MILVTAGTGYLGRALVARLIEDGERVRVLGRGRPAGPGEAWPGDVTRPELLDAALEGVGTVYHLAALVDHYASEETLHRVNVQGTVHVLEAALRHGVSLSPSLDAVAASRQALMQEARTTVSSTKSPSPMATWPSTGAPRRAARLPRRS